MSWVALRRIKAPRDLPIRRGMKLASKLLARIGWDRLSPRDRPLAKLMLGLGFGALACVLGSILLVVREHRALHPKVVHHVEEPAESHGAEGEGGGLIQIARDIPKEILDRRDGQMEEGHDLVEPEISETRGLASLIKNPPAPVELTRFVTLEEIFSGTKIGKRAGGAVITEIVLEVTNFEAEQEALLLKSQFRSIIASMASEFQQEELKTFKGKAALKARIQKELNLRMHKGRVKDVLFSSFIIR